MTPADWLVVGVIALAWTGIAILIIWSKRNDKRLEASRRKADEALARYIQRLTDRSST